MPTVVLHFRKADYDLLERLAREHTTPALYCREIIESFLSDKRSRRRFTAVPEHYYEQRSS